MKKTAVAALILVCLIALGVVCVRPVRAQYQGDITINADGSVSPSSAPIQQTGNTYVLTSNINGSITVQRNNTVLDGNGHTLISGGLMGGPDSYAAITINHLLNVTVKNFTIACIQGYYYKELLFGIDVESSSNVTLMNNTITGTGTILFMNGVESGGIYVGGGGSSIISGNSLVDNLNAMGFSDTSYNLIVGNNIKGGLTAYNGWSGGIYFKNASNNTIYHNNFVNNLGGQADVLDSMNIWDDGYPLGGNYWDDYLTKYHNATMIDHSGIGDTPYIIDGANKDRYPLMEPFNEFYISATTPPKITIMSPVKQTYNESNVSLNFTVDKDVDWTGYSLDGRQNVTIAGNDTITNIPNGLHSITVYANDTFGNMGASQTITFTVAVPEPFPTTLVAVASVASVAVIGVILLIYFRKRK